MSEWFEEQLEIEAGRVLKVKIRKKLASVKSDFQQIDVYETEAFGKMLVHDDVIMLTESDECGYHEMIAHVPMNVHPNPKKVLVIGGGDGGTLTEVLKHSSVETAHLCEIDKKVVDVCKIHFPSLSNGFSDSRATLYFEDGAQFVKKREGFYDIIIVDSSDPIGPAEVLFQKEFYQSMYNALAPDGIVVTQSESFMYHRDIIQHISDFSRKLFPIYRYYYTMVPTYPSGVIGFSFCSKKYDPTGPLRDNKEMPIDTLNYYTKEIHNASFQLPAAFRRFLNL